MQIRNRFTFALLVAAQMCMASPVPEPDPYHKTHIKIHVPHEVHTLHHHHVSHVPVIKHVPIIKEVPVYKEVTVVKPVPIIKTVGVPIVHTEYVEKPILVSHSHWH
ncbi:hypothetical protein evm_007605 [Chilo suppressalis]|nr:hypothetical protein evm_007605 [Chilo suppressalis]